MTLNSDTYLIELTDDFVEQSQTFQPLFVDVALVIKFFVIGYGGKHDGYAGISLVIEVLCDPCAEEMLSDVSRQDVLQKDLGENGKFDILSSVRKDKKLFLGKT